VGSGGLFVTWDGLRLDGKTCTDLYEFFFVSTDFD
jgi:hypothetical protein